MGVAENGNEGHTPGMHLGHICIAAYLFDVSHFNGAGLARGWWDGVLDCIEVGARNLFAVFVVVLTLDASAFLSSQQQHCDF